MRKLLFLAAGVVLVAAACNTQPQSNQSPTPPPAQNNAPNNSAIETNTSAATSAKVDALITEINAAVDSEQNINTQSDEDVVNSDQALITEYEGVSNASF